MILARDDILINIRVAGESAYPRLEKRSDSLGKESRRLGKRMAELGQVVTGVDCAVNLPSRAWHGLQRAMDAASGPVGLAIAFEQEFGQIQTLTDGVGDALEQGLLDLAGRVPQTAGDITKVAYQAISVGIDFLDAASKLAVPGATGMTESVDLLTTAVNAYKERGLETGRASDILFATVRAGKTTIEELTQSLGQAAPASAQFGISLEEVGAATAVLTKSGLSTSEASINALVKPSSAAAKKLKALGVEFGVSALESEGLTDVLEDLQAKSGGSAEALGTLFTRFEATQGLLGVMSGGLKTYHADLESITNATGATAKANATMAATTQGAIDSFKALSEGVLREVSQELMPVFNEEMAKLSAWINDNREEIVAFARDFADGLCSVAKWAVEDAPTLLKTFAVMFVAGKIQMAAKTLTAFRAELALTGPTAAAAGGSVGSLLGAGLRSAPVVAAAVAGGLLPGQRHR